MRKDYAGIFLLFVFALLINGCSDNKNTSNPVTPPSGKGSISGKVLDQITSAGISGATVTTNPATTTAVTDVNGNYTLSELPPATYTVSAVKNGYALNSTSVVVLANQGATVNIPFSLASSKGALGGKITDVANNNGLVGVTVSLQPTGVSVTTNAIGNYSFTNLDPGVYTVTANKAGYIAASGNVIVLVNETAKLDLVVSVIPPDPIVSFTFTGALVSPATLNFINNSQNANSFHWDFGDGTSSNENVPFKVYSTYGTYIVTLTATNTATGKSVFSSKDIVIAPGKVFLQRLYIDAIPLADANGISWDLNSGPDVMFNLIDSMGTALTNLSSYYSDITLSALPIWWTYAPEYQIPSTNKAIFIAVWDYNSLNSNDLIGTTYGFRKSMGEIAGYPTTYNLQNPSGTIKVRLQLRWQ